MTQIPLYSLDDQQAPYKSYSALARLIVDGGAVQMPLAYKATPPGQPLPPVARILQVAQPRMILTINWRGTRINMKPQPPLITAAGSFLLAQAGGQVDGIAQDSGGNDIISASGFLVLLSADHPSGASIPAFWLPWDGRYSTGADQVPLYTYTPTDLGFGGLLPDAQPQPNPAPPPFYGNPPLKRQEKAMFLI